jgi:hypothetical protein
MLLYNITVNMGFPHPRQPILSHSIVDTDRYII